MASATPVSTTRITIVLEVDHDPAIDLPARAGEYLQQALSDVDGLASVTVLGGETEDLVWTPERRRRAS
jgi:multidrug efflux pump subunit AcrB